MNYSILVIAPAWVGDMVMAQSLFKALKLQNPNCTIDVLALPWVFPILERMPEVRAGISMPLGHGQLNLKMRYQLAKKLSANHYQQAILLVNTFKSALIPFWAGIPKRTGWLGEMRYGLVNDYRKLDKKVLPRMVDRFTALAFPKDSILSPAVPNPELMISKDSLDKALSDFNIKIAEKPILALCPGAEHGTSKKWPPTYFSELANAHIAKGWEVWIFGSQNDVAVANEIQSLTNNRCKMLAGNTSLGQAIDLLSLASVVVANDSGLMHVASSLNKPTIAIYGSTPSEFAPPLSDKGIILEDKNLACRPCGQRHCPLKHHQCMKNIHPSEVIRAIELCEF